jgi:serine protease Do
MFFRRKKDKTHPSADIIPVVALSALFGLAAGMVGMLIMLAYFPAIGLQTQWGRDTFSTPAIQIQARHTTAEFVIRDLAASSVLLFLAEDSAEIFLTTKAIGAGVVLTSDGWLLTHNSVLANAHRADGKNLIALIDKTSFNIERAIVDPFTDVAFLKVNGVNLPVASFGKSETLTVGDALFSFDVTGGLREAGVIALDAVPIESLAGAVRSSEKIQRVLRLSEAADFVPGAAVLNSVGETVGIFVGKGAVGTYAIPLDSFFRQVGDVLRDDFVSRPYFGVRFVDLSEFPATDGPNRGVQIKSIGKNTPAAFAGLRESDIITAVNGELITSNKSLADILVEYRIGETVNLTLIRSGSELEIDVTLTKAPNR